MNKSPIQIPSGYRLLDEGERILPGDIYNVFPVHAAWRPTLYGGEGDNMCAPPRLCPPYITRYARRGAVDLVVEAERQGAKLHRADVDGGFNWIVFDMHDTWLWNARFATMLDAARAFLDYKKANAKSV